MKEITSSKDVLAYTKFEHSGVEYCSTVDELNGGRVLLYIIDPKGVDFLKSYFPNIKITTIFVSVYYDLILERAEKRGDIIDDVYRRLEYEANVFDPFFFDNNYDYYIDNTKPIGVTYKQVDDIMLEVLGDMAYANKY
jgi:hypothetical protein